MQTENKQPSKIKKALKDLVTKNVVLKIISLVFALLLWGYVLMDTQPVRVKVVTDVPVSFDGEADLLARNLVVNGDRDEILKNVTVRVSTELTNYADLDASDVRAAISLRNLSNTGEYTVSISATTSVGTVLSVSPNTVVLSIDDLVTRRVPVELRYDDTSLQEGYWCGDPTISRSEVDITGAYGVVSSVNKAVCSIDLSNRTESIHESVILSLMDADGNEIPVSELVQTLPTVTVDMDIYRTVTLPVDAASFVMGEESLPVNYEIAGESVTPSSITLTGPDELLDAYTELDISPLDVSGRTESLLKELEIAVPDGLQILGDSTVSAYINIRELRSTVTFLQIPIEVRGAGKDGAVLQVDTLTMTVTGPVSIMSGLGRGDIVAYVDITDLEPGTYSLDIRTDASNRTLLEKLFVELSLDSVTVQVP